MEIRSDSFTSAMIRVETPDGTMFVNCIEDRKGELDAIQIFIGKSGTNLAAWTDSVARMVTLSIEHGADIAEIVKELTGITSDRLTFMTGKVPIRSGPEGIAVALIKYQQNKAQQIRNKSNVRHSWRG